MDELVYGSVCSGIEAATVAWEPLGWKAAFYSEIDKFPSAVLKHHYPTVPNAGDFTTIQDGDYATIDLLVGGTPCQDFSVAGLRAGVAGDRGNLTLEFLRLAQRLRSRWLVWENVPGVYSSTSHIAPDPREPGDDLHDSAAAGHEEVVADEYDAVESHAFACFLAGLQELGYGFAYRTLDAQHFGVPQRRRRVFVVGHLGDWRRAAAVLFERHSLSGHPPPRREKGQTAPTVPSRRTGGGARESTLVAFSCKDHGADAGDISPTLRSMGHAGSHANAGGQVAVAFRTAGDGCVYEEGDRTAPLTTSTDPNTTVIAMNLRGCEGGAMPELDDVASLRAASGGSSRSYVVGLDSQLNAEVEGIGPLTIGSASGGGQPARVATTMAVRRLTPRECERLQGFPDDYTKIGDKTADGPRYKALGNSMAVPVMRWIGERIAEVERLA